MFLKILKSTIRRSLVVPKLQSSIFWQQILAQSLRNFEICFKIIKDWSKKLLIIEKTIKKFVIISLTKLATQKFYSNVKKFGASEKICSK